MGSPVALLAALLGCEVTGPFALSKTTNSTNFTNLASAYLFISNSTNAKVTLKNADYREIISVNSCHQRLDIQLAPVRPRHGEAAIPEIWRN